LSQNVYGAISSFGAGYVGYKSRTLGKGYGVQCGVIGNSFGNTLGTRKSNTHTLPQKKKILGLVGACCLTSLVASMFLQVLA
jgi:hypothetical protein